MSPRLPSRSAQLVQPSSPFTPRMDNYNLKSPQRRPRPGRQTSSSGSLKLPSLPRFHPANFPSQQTTEANTPTTGPNSPQPPLSPRTAHQQYSQAQKQLYMYQRELLAGMNRPGSNSGAKPASPRLIPMGSPGPVTPLELEDHGSGDYLMAGSGTGSGAPGELVDKLIREEKRRLGQPSSPRAGTSVAG